MGFPFAFKRAYLAVCVDDESKGDVPICSKSKSKESTANRRVYPVHSLSRCQHTWFLDFLSKLTRPVSSNAKHDDATSHGDSWGNKRVEPHLGLKDATISTCQSHNDPIRQRSTVDTAKDVTDEWAQCHASNSKRCKVVRWLRKDDGDNRHVENKPAHAGCELQGGKENMRKSDDVKRNYEEMWKRLWSRCGKTKALSPCVDWDCRVGARHCGRSSMSVYFEILFIVFV